MNYKTISLINISAVGLSFAEFIEWGLRIVLLVITIIISLPELENVLKKFHRRFIKGKDV